MKQSLLLFLTSFLFFSCLSSSDDDDNQLLSKSEINRCFTLTRGNYNGYLVYPAQNPNKASDQADTLDINWTVTADTMLVVDRFPAKAIAGNITLNDELKTALIEQNPTQKMSCYMVFYQADPTIMFMLAPQMMEFPVFYDGATHTVKAYYWSNNVNQAISHGARELSTSEMVVRIVLGAIYLDNNETNNLLGTASTYMIPVYLTTSL